MDIVSRIEGTGRIIGFYSEVFVSIYINIGYGWPVSLRRFDLPHRFGRVVDIRIYAIKNFIMNIFMVKV